MTTSADIREALLQVIAESQPKTPSDQQLDRNLVLREVRERLRPKEPIPNMEQQILTEWHELLRTGYVAWGFSLLNPNPPHFHVTDRGQRTLTRLSRDPGNPSGYLANVLRIDPIDPVAYSYLAEALQCYVSGLFKAAAVLTGVAAEALILDLRNEIVARADVLNISARQKKDLSNWLISPVLDAIYSVLNQRAADMPRKLREEFGAYWTAFTQQIRSTRNEAGHPTGTDPVTEDAVHASLLIFPSLIKLQSDLSQWVRKDLQK